jgi:hypothetical protein
VKRLRLSLLLLGAITLSGCVVPIPHKRLHEPGVAGRVIDSESHLPIEAAKIEGASNSAKVTLSDASGSFKLKPVYGWHGAYFIGPICLSLFPGFDVPVHTRAIVITADGFQGVTLSPGTLTFDEYIQTPDIPLKRQQ